MDKYSIYINVRDRLTMTRRLAEQCVGLDQVGKVVLVDNDSSYPPLLEWYRNCPFEVIRLDRNGGTRGAWLVLDGSGFYVETDNDLDISRVPKDLLLLLREGLENNPKYIKAGLSLEIEGIPDTYVGKQMVFNYESAMWKKKLEGDDRFYIADIDTTFAMYRPGSGWGYYRPSLRTERPYTAVHTTWHEPSTEEDLYYIERLNPQHSCYGSVEQRRLRRSKDGKPA